METWGLANLVCQRSHFSIAIVCMVNHTAVNLMTSQTPTPFHNQTPGINDLSNITGNPVEYLTLGPTDSDGMNAGMNNSILSENSDCQSFLSDRNEDGEFVWTKDTQGFLLGSLFWTFVIMQIPSALFLDRFLTPKVAMVGTMTFISVVNLLSPLLARWSPWAVFAGRLLVGIGNATFMIGLNTIWRKWAPPKERSRLLGFAYSGTQFANCVVFPLSALLCRSVFFGGWPSIFYVFGGVSLVWCGLMVIVVYDSPKKHPWITQTEKEYITSTISYSTHKRKEDSIPWLSIMTSLPVWANCIAAFTYIWACIILVSTMPMYMREVLRMDMKSNV